MRRAIGLIVLGIVLLVLTGCTTTHEEIKYIGGVPAACSWTSEWPHWTKADYRCEPLP